MLNGKARSLSFIRGSGIVAMEAECMMMNIDTDVFEGG
jgi:hypothetical protein